MNSINTTNCDKKTAEIVRQVIIKELMNVRFWHKADKLTELRSALSEKRVLTLVINIRFVLFCISLERKNIASAIYPALF